MRLALVCCLSVLPLAARAQPAATATDGFQLAGPVARDLPVAQRALQRHFPKVTTREWDAFRYHSEEAELYLARLLERAPAELLVFAAADVRRSVRPADSVPAADVRKDEAMFLLWELRDGMVLALTLEGEMQVLLAEHLAAAPSVPARFPTVPRKADLDFDDARHRSVPEDQPLHDKFEVESAKFEACADKIWKKVVGDLPYDYDLLIVKGTHSTSVRELANRKIEKACNGKRMAKITIAYVQALNDARVRRRQALVDGLHKRYQALLQPVGP